MISPISASGDNDESVTVQETFFKQPHVEDKEKAVAKPAAKVILPDPSNTAAAIQNYFQPNQAAELVSHRQSTTQRQRLGREDIAVCIFGKDYTSDELSESATPLMNSILFLVNNDGEKEALTEFHNLPSSLQGDIVALLLKEKASSSLVDFLNDIKQEVGLAEYRQDIEKYTTTFRSNMMSSLNTLRDTFNETVQSIAESIQEKFGTDDLREIHAVIVATEDTALIASFEKFQMSLTGSCGRLVQINRDRVRGAISPEVAGLALSNTIIQVELMREDFFSKLADSGIGETERDTVSVQTVAAQDKLNIAVADIVRTTYKETDVVIRLERTAYDIVNKSLECSGQPGLASMFQQPDSPMIQSAEDISFLLEQYEFSKPETLKNLNIFMQCLYSLVIQNDSENREVNKKAQLDENRQLDAFAEELARKVKLQGQQLTRLKDKQRLTSINTALYTYKQILEASRNANSVTAIINKGVKQEFGSLKLLLEQESNKKLAVVLYSLSDIA